MSDMNRQTDTALTLSIGKLSEQTGISRRALRHYETAGLLESRRADNGYRYFSTGAVTRVRQIQRFIAAGFSLEDIRSFPECMLILEGASPCAVTLASQRERLETLSSRITELERRRTLLQALLAESEAAASQAQAHGKSCLDEFVGGHDGGCRTESPAR